MLGALDGDLLGVLFVGEADGLLDVGEGLLPGFFSSSQVSENGL